MKAFHAVGYITRKNFYHKRYLKIYAAIYTKKRHQLLTIAEIFLIVKKFRGLFTK